MPAQSQQQQKLFGLALSVKRGETPRSEASKEVLDIVDSMSEKQIEDFAGTEHSGLPKKVESQLRGVVREIMRERVISEAAGKEAMGIAAFTGTRGDAVQKFIDDNKLDAKKLFNYVKGGKLTDRLNFVTAIVGTPGNSVQKKMIKMFGESVTEALSVDPRKVYGGTGAKEGMVLVAQKGLEKILDLSKKNPSNVFLVSDDNYTKFGPYYVKNGKVAKYTVANPNYDFEKNKVRTLKVPSDVILKFRIMEGVSINEDTKKRFDVDFYKIMGDRQTSHEEIIRGDKFSDVISQATKVAKSKGMDYVEFYYKDAFIGSIDKKSNYTFKKGRNSDKSPLSVNEEKYPIAVEKFNKELIKHPMVKKAADFYKKTPAEIVKVLQQRLYTKGDKTGNTKEVYIDFKDTTSGITIKHKMKFNESLESVNEASYNFGKEEYTKKNMTPTQILDLAMAYAKVPGKGNPMYNNKMENMIKVANDLARLNGTKQMDAKARGSQPALLLFLLKNQLVTKDEYVKLYKNLLEKQISVVKALKNADPAARMIGGAAARQAHKDMRGEFDTE